MRAEIKVNLAELIDIIKNEHTIEETIQILNEAFPDWNADEDIDDVDYNDKETTNIITNALLDIENFEDIIKYYDNNDLICNSFFTYIDKGNSVDDINSNLYCMLLDKLVSEGYITNLGFSYLDEYFHNTSVNRFEDLSTDFIWNMHEFKYTGPDCIKDLVIAFLELEYDAKFVHSVDQYTDAPYKYIMEHIFSGFGGAKDALREIILPNFSLIKNNKNMAVCFGTDKDRFNLTPDTSEEKFEEYTSDLDYNILKESIYVLCDETDFLKESGIYDNYFGK